MNTDRASDCPTEISIKRIPVSDLHIGKRVNEVFHDRRSGDQEYILLRIIDEGKEDAVLIIWMATGKF